MRVLVRAVALSVVVLVSGSAAAAEALRPHLVIQFASESGRAGETVTVEVTSLDASGGKVDAPISLDVDAGKATPPQRTGTGVYRSTISLPTRLPVSRSLLVLARAGALSAEASLRLTPGPAATMHLDGSPGCAEDAEACRIDVTVVDGYGNPAAEVPDASAELGSVLPAGAADPGHWVIIYHPPRVDREREDRVTIEVGKLKDVHAFHLAPSSTRLGFAPLLGGVRQDSHIGFTAGGQALTERPVGSGWLMGAGIEGSWWSVSRSGEVSGLHVSTDRSQIAVGFFVQAERPVSGRTIAALSLGGGAVRVNSTAHVEGQPGVSDSGWAPTARGAVLLGYRFTFGMPFVEARAAWVGDAHLVTDPGAQWPLFLQLGYRLDVR